MKTTDRSLRNLEKNRGLYFRLGLMISLVITFFAFEWRTPVAREEITFPAFDDGIEEEMMPVTFRREQVMLPDPELSTLKKTDPIQPADDFIIIPDDKTPSILKSDSIVIPDIIPIDRRAEPAPIIDDFFLLPEVQPEFPGGDEALVDYLKQHIVYPERMRKEGITGAAYVNFIIDENGQVTRVSIQHATSEMFAEEAIRVINEMPRWNPGKQGGKNVRVMMTIPVIFRLL